ncbi:MAG: hypothetical protein UV46_C0058G0006 [Candidatus Gottesmanbacteria bacterium GW2011_GWC2_42_8]|nr:MAG: hypothetical protein UV46_C0058G0006 [Candidatus Gottesmanbacteria bacterium GW2011_GWC2_42_8]
MKKYNSGGFALVILLFLMVLAVTVITAAVSLMILGSSSSTLLISGDSTKSIADSCIENAIIRLIRNPAYSGESLDINEGNCQITVTGLTDKTVSAQANYGNKKKRVEVNLNLNNNIISLISWKDVP